MIITLNLVNDFDQWIDLGQPVTIFPGDTLSATVTWTMPVELKLIPNVYIFTPYDPPGFNNGFDHFHQFAQWRLIGHQSIGLDFSLAYNGPNFIDDGRVFQTIPWGVGAVPEPATWALMLLGFALIGRRIRKAII
jgi:hypothetical protein